MTRLETRAPPLVLLGLAGLLVWVVGRLEVGRAPMASAVGVALGVSLVATGVVIVAAGAIEFRRAATTVDPRSPEQTAKLVTTGVYRFTRNPMYVGMLLVLAGWASLLGTIVGFAAGGSFLLLVLTRLQIVPEERMLASKFGDAYHEYCSTVGRWSRRIRPREDTPGDSGRERP